MPADSDSTDRTQAAQSVSLQVGDPPAQAADAQQSSKGSADDGGSTGLDAASLQRELTAARREAASYRTKLKTFEDADKTEAQKALDRIAELETELTVERTARQSMAVQVASISTARKLGFKDPELAVRLVSASDVEFGEDGSPKNIERLLGDIAKQYPALVATAASSGLGPRGTPAAGGPDLNTWIRKEAGRT